MRHLLAATSLIFLAGTPGGVAFTSSTVGLADAPQRLDAADLDGDGDLDLFVLADGPGQSSSLQVLLNGGGMFTPGWSAVDGTGTLDLPWDINLADTDSDGDADVLYVLPSGSPFQRFNDGNGSFDSFGYLPAFALRAEQEPADMDDNGDVDIVYFEEDIIGYFGTLKGHGDGSFKFDISTEIFSGLGGFDLHRRFVAGDATGDGLRDAAMASKDGLRFIEGRPGSPGSSLPAWLAPELLFPTGCRDVVMADLNGDARLDIMASVPSLHSVVTFLTQASGHFGGPRLYAAGTAPDAIAAADLDLDGNIDVIVTDTRNSSLNVLYGSGSGSLSASAKHSVGRRPTDVVAADLDGDGDIDLAVTCAGEGTVALLFNTTL